MKNKLNEHANNTKIRMFANGLIHISDISEQKY